MEVNVPYLYNNDRDYARLAQLINSVLSIDSERVTFKFQDCGFLMANAVVVLGGLCRLMESRGTKVTLDVESMREPVYKNLGRSDFLKAHCDIPYPWIDNAVPYREDPEPDPLGAATYLENDWLGRSWPIKLDPALRAAITGRVVEIYLNAFEHSGSPVGVFSCGQYYRNKRRLQLAVADFGSGIPANVRRFVGSWARHEKISTGAECIEWAFKPGTSTNPIMGRGLGLDLLREFLMVNGGTMKILSGDAIAEVASEGATYRDAPHYFQGTLVDLEIACDEQSYKLEKNAAEYAVRRVE